MILPIDVPIYVLRSVSIFLSIRYSIDPNITKPFTAPPDKTIVSYLVSINIYFYLLHV
jgi:hypothetical protein